MRAMRWEVICRSPNPRRIIVLHVRELEEVSETETVTAHLNSRNAKQEVDVFLSQQICPTNEDAAGTIQKSGLARRQHRGENLVVQLLQIRYRMEIENHEIAGESLQSPVVVHSQ